MRCEGLETLLVVIALGGLEGKKNGKESNRRDNKSSIRRMKRKAERKLRRSVTASLPQCHPAECSLLMMLDPFAINWNSLKFAARSGSGSMNGGSRPKCSSTSDRI